MRNTIFIDLKMERNDVIELIDLIKKEGSDDLHYYVEFLEDALKYQT